MSKPRSAVGRPRRRTRCRSGGRASHDPPLLAPARELERVVEQVGRAPRATSARSPRASGSGSSTQLDVAIVRAETRLGSARLARAARSCRCPGCHRAARAARSRVGAGRRAARWRAWALRRRIGATMSCPLVVELLAVIHVEDRREVQDRAERRLQVVRERVGQRLELLRCAPRRALRAPRSGGGAPRCWPERAAAGRELARRANEAQSPELARRAGRAPLRARVQTASR